MRCVLACVLGNQRFVASCDRPIHHTLPLEITSDPTFSFRGIPEVLLAGRGSRRQFRALGEQQQATIYNQHHLDGDDRRENDASSVFFENHVSAREDASEESRTATASGSRDRHIVGPVDRRTSQLGSGAAD